MYIYFLYLYLYIYLYIQLNLDKSNCQGKQEFVRLIEVSTYRLTSLEVQLCFQMPPEHIMPSSEHSNRI